MSDGGERRRESELVDGDDDEDVIDRVLDEPVEEIELAALEVWRNLTGPEGYLPVLLLIFVSMVSIPLVGDSKFGALFNVFLISTGLLFTVYRSTHRPHLRRISTALMVAGAGAGSIAVVLFQDETTEPQIVHVILMVLYLAMLLVCFPMVLVRSFQHRKVSVNTVCATLSAYLIIGLSFMAAYRLFGLFTPFFTQANPSNGQPGIDPTAGQYAYFSFITLTTVGYGDLTPGSDAARSLVMIEAVLGQVFLVTTMARVISLLGEQRQFRLREGGLTLRTRSDQGESEASPD